VLLIFSSKKNKSHSSVVLFLYSLIGESREAKWVLVGKPDGRKPLGKPRRRWENNIKMDLQ
jgi:hypothetical protein